MKPLKEKNPAFDVLKAPPCKGRLAALLSVPQKHGLTCSKEEVLHQFEWGNNQLSWRNLLIKVLPLGMWHFQQRTQQRGKKEKVSLPVKISSLCLLLKTLTRYSAQLDMKPLGPDMMTVLTQPAEATFSLWTPGEERQTPRETQCVQV